ncbi:DUF4234 domain-containing protein [Nocardioides sp. SR21]|uniref:DUF4234 domain-containing protein n=1 Tax=Nocardioides sp. SR21 TaxID=2919501 RepID=UPI001FA98C0A|nr:DUF4234 domain-containing protein [Nocardioides sp. SR21]
MSDTNDSVPAPDTTSAAAPPPYSAPSGSVAPAPAAPVAAYAAPAAGPVGKVRSTGTCVLLTIVTLGFYTWYWWYKVHAEMKEHSGQGIGGPIALLLAVFVGIVMPFISSSEVGGLYERRGQQRPVSASTGLWYILLGWFFLVGAIVWFVKTNGALNDYWRSQGAQG